MEREVSVKVIFLEKREPSLPFLVQTRKLSYYDKDSCKVDKITNGNG